MKVLILKNGVSYNFTNSSTIHTLDSVVNDFDEVSGISANMTTENLSECVFDGVRYTDVIPVSITAKSESGKITLKMINEGGKSA